MPNKNGYFTTSDLKRVLLSSRHSNRTIEIVPDSLRTRVTIVKCPTDFRRDPPKVPNSTEQFATEHYYQSFWISGNEISRHVIIEEAIYWIRTNLS